MNTTQAKQIKITTLLNVQSDKNEFLILSPLHNEKTPSFKINKCKNTWYDFALGKGGTIIDLVMQLKKCNIREALQFLENSSFSFSPAKQNITRKVEKETQKQKIEIAELKSSSLLNYLVSRKINLTIAKKYLVEAKKEKYRYIAFKNDSTGYELRNNHFKGCHATKDITTIQTRGSKKVAIFEGFFDFLSALTYYQKQNAKIDIIILNSTSMAKKLNLEKYEKVFLYLDNDLTGKNATKEIMSRHKNVVDNSTIYRDYKDFNEFLLNLNVKR